MKQERIIKRNIHEYQKGPILYWMNRDMRVQDNWALLYANELANGYNVPLHVAYNLDPHFLGGGRRQVDFKIGALKEIEKDLHLLGIAFHLIVESETIVSLSDFCKKECIGAIVTDFSPLRLQEQWVQNISTILPIPLYQVDTHNIIPIWTASPKQEFGAYTIRPKIHKLLPQFLDTFPTLEKSTFPLSQSPIDWEKVEMSIQTDESVPSVDWPSGEKAALDVLQEFLTEKLPTYATARNDPNSDALSDLSPYLHYGMISAQHIALETILQSGHEEAKEAFLEELIVRRELADNFCHYNPHYDSPEGYPAWAKKSLLAHKNDPREYVYSKETFENTKTHDPLWNATQRQMMTTGKMHGYMRMYWAKKILEWTPDISTAHEIALYLNDKYELDGRDPNGYAGIAWALGGVHDRAWVSRPVFGQIRYMNFNGCKRKFDVNAYMAKWNG